MGLPHRRVEAFKYTDLRAALREAAPEGIDVAVDMVGGDFLEPIVRSLAFDGRCVVVGFASGTIPKIPANLLLVKNTKEGAIVGGPAFLKGVGNDVLDSILSKNIPINLDDEKYGEALTSSVDRIVAALEGKADPGPPVKYEKSREKTYKTKVVGRFLEDL